MNQSESEQRTPEMQPSATTRLRLRLWLISCGIGALTWAIVLASLYHFVSNSLPLVDDDSVVNLIRDRFLFSFGFTAPLLGALTYFAVLLIVGQQQEVEETRAKLRQAKADALPSKPPSAESLSSKSPSSKPLSNKEAQRENLAREKDSPQKDSLQKDSLQKDSQQQNRLQTDLVLLLSQQYRTPLTTILSSSELIERYGADWAKERIDKHLHRIMASVQTMTGLLNDTLLLVGQSETGVLQLDPVVLNLNQFVQNVAQSMEAQATEERATEERVTEEQATEAAITDINASPNDAADSQPTYQQGRIRCELLAETFSVEGDPRLLRSIIENVLSNALQYSPPESMVHLRLTYQQDKATIQIQDRGVGIAKKDQAAVFQPFFRTQQAAGVRGCGLGLAIAQVCTELHGGTITLESNEGQGTTVTITLALPSASTSSSISQ